MLLSIMNTAIIATALMNVSAMNAAMIVSTSPIDLHPYTHIQTTLPSASRMVTYLDAVVLEASSLLNNSLMLNAFEQTLLRSFKAPLSISLALTTADLGK
jgi:hypothetical protein